MTDEMTEADYTIEDTPESWPVLSSKVLAEGGISAYHEDLVRMVDGTEARRQYTTHHGAVGVVALDDAGRMLTLRQYRHPVRRLLWELPAGLLDKPGEHPLEAAKRELYEEAHLQAAEWRVLVDLVSAPGFSDESVRVYLATGITDVGRPDAHDEEADLQVQWFPLDEARHMVLAGEIVNSIAVAGILAAHDVEDPSSLRPVDAPWIDRSKAFAARRADT